MAASVTPDTTTPARKLLGVRATAEVQRIIAEAAECEHRSVSSFVLRAALDATRSVRPKPRRSLEEVKAIVRTAQQAFQAATPAGRDILEEFLAERRAETTSE